MEQNRQEENTVQLRDILGACISNWYWILISVFLCVGAAAVKILCTAPEYQRYATILIKETNVRRVSSNDLESLLSNGGMGVSASKLVNEVVAFKSPYLMKEVVKRLGLDVEYAFPGTFHESVVYGAMVPVSTSYPDAAVSTSLSYRLQKTGDSTFVITKLSYRKPHDRKTYSCSQTFNMAAGDTLETPAGRITISLNPLYTKAWESPLIIRKTTPAAATGHFSAAFSAHETDIKNRSDVMNLMITDVNTARADDILNMVINVYNENWVEDRNKVAVSTSQFIKDRLESIEKELGNVDEDIAGYKSANLMPDVKAVSSLYMTQSAETDRQIQEIDNQLYLSRYIRNYLTTSVGTKQLIPMASSITNSGIASQITEYNTVLLNRNNIASNSSESNPLVLDLDASLDAMQAAILSSIDNQINTLEIQNQSLRMKEAKNTAKIAASPTQAKYLLSVERQQKVKESLYLYLLQKREENELSQAFTAYNTRLITPPTGGGPVSPKRNQILLIALLAGLCIPIGIFYLREVLNTKVRGRKDVENLNIPFLGEIPQFDQEAAKKSLISKIKPWDKKTDESTIVIREGNRNIINEAFRVLRANLEFMFKGSNHDVVLVTSFNPGSGKTFLTANIAAVLSIRKKKVLVIDGDLRRGSLSAIINSPETGLADYLAGQVDDFRECIHTYPKLKNLDFLPVGTIPPNPSELIGDEKFSNLVKELKQEYDLVFIDCPPVDIVADTQMISHLADKSVFVVRAGLLERSMIPQIDRLYEEKRFKDMGLVLNGTECASGHYGKSYGYGYGQKAGYGYGYGQSSEKES